MPATLHRRSTEVCLPTSEQIAAEVRRRPIGAVIADICRDLGITPSHPLGPEVHNLIIRYGGDLANLVRDLVDRAFERPASSWPPGPRSPCNPRTLPQAIAAAAFFLDFDGLIVPSARSTELNLVVFAEKTGIGERLRLEASELVDWSSWRSPRRKRTATS